MTQDYTYLMTLPDQELIERARMATGLTTSAAHLMRALADTLETTGALCDTLADANANLQADLDAALDERDEWQGLAEQLNGVVKGLHR